MIRAEPRFAELATATNFSFLRGASHPEELVAQAAHLGLTGIGIADRNSLAGVVRAHVFARENAKAIGKMRVVTGARLVFTDGTPDILAYPRDRDAYGRLCRLLTVGNLRAEKGQCHLTLKDLLEWGQGLQIVAMAEASPAAPAEKSVARGAMPEGGHDASFISCLREAFPDRLWLAASMTYGASMRGDLATRVALSRRTGIPLLATNDVLMHGPERRPLADVVACIREGVKIDDAGRLLEANAERHLKDAREMARLFREAPEALEATVHFLDGLKFSLDELKHNYPEELREGYSTPQEALEAFAREGARARYPNGVPPNVTQALDHELALVAELEYAPYFLTVHDIVRYARSENVGILAQGRGSAANSTICYCLGITEVDPSKHDLLFARFISTDRKEPPDIDVDFEHERREEVIQYIYRHYKPERAGLAAAVITYRTRSAVREVAKTFGLSDDLITVLTSTTWGQSSGKIKDAEMRSLGLDPSDRALAMAIELAGELSGFPRHLSQHSGGFVITRDRLDEVVPIMNAAMDNRTTIEWDKDDLNALGILKVDVLALGMLTALRKGFELIDKHYDRRLTLSNIPPEEACVYAMIQRADTIGVFQIESRAQMSMLPRLRPEKFYDLVIEVAIVRPGPIQGDMVHPYLRRRQGIDEVGYPSEELEAVLSKTLGIPLFQEQAMKIAIVAGFKPEEADQLRRAMATFKRVGTIGLFETKMIEGMVAKGYDRDFAARCFKQIEGFGSYGFPESHAASFALLVYASAWIKCRYPDVFCASLLNAQPMGFYAPSQIVRDAREHGVEVREADANLSDWDCTLERDSDPFSRCAGEGGPRVSEGRMRAVGSIETSGVVDMATALIRPDFVEPLSQGECEAFVRPAVREKGFPIHRRHASMAPDIRTTHAVRLGFRQILGMSEADMKRLVERRGAGYDSVRDLWLRTGLNASVLERLADADAFRSLGLDRRMALWAVRGLDRVGDQDDLPLFSASRPTREHEPDAKLPPMPLGAHVVEDYRSLALSLKAHPVAFMRRRLEARGILRSEALAEMKSGARVAVAGLVLVRQRPGTASGVIFMTIEDETGIANVIVWPKVFERLRPIVIGARFVAVTGKLQSEAGVIHLIADRLEDLTSMLGLLSERGPQLDVTGPADEARRPPPAGGDRRGSKTPRAAPIAAPAPVAQTTDIEERDLIRAMPGGRNFH
ncbi:error-prone DNA polymerase [Methylocapsa sp. S129]|uniref:error-prone DNA polymerase n=1 Tax=Methylocapsa sp. S129 TaxID=1641869 RepID=UPI00131B9415|nr:error-prone DNA polymerase [Methylocapsa sp. S129]